MKYLTQILLSLVFVAVIILFAAYKLDPEKLESRNWTFWYDNQKVSSQTNTLQSNVVEYYDNGKKKKEFLYQEGAIANTIVWEYYDNGNTKSVVNYNHSDLHTKVQKWYLNGQTKLVANYNKCKRNSRGFTYRIFYGV